MRQKDVIVKGMYGKKLMSLAACENMIADLDHRQKTERLTAIEERAILKDLRELKDTMPLIKQVDEKDEGIDEVKKKKKVIGKKIHEKIEQRNLINQSIDLIKEKQKTEKGEEAPKKDAKKDDKPKHPLTLKIDELKEGIEALRKEKSDLKDAHEKRYQAWKDQNEIELKRSWIQKIQKRLKIQKEIADREAAYKAEEDRIREEKEEYERKWGKPKKYQTQIDVCENLLSFLHGLKPKDAQVAESDITFDKDAVDQK